MACFVVTKINGFTEFCDSFGRQNRILVIIKLVQLQGVVIVQNKEKPESLLLLFREANSPYNPPVGPLVYNSGEL